MIIDNVQNKEAFSKSLIFKDLTGHKKRVFALDWNLNGTRLASGSADCNIRIWDTASILEQDKFSSQELKGHQDYVTHLKFNPFDENVLISCSSDKTIRLWDIRISNKSVKSEKTRGGCKNITWNHDFGNQMFAFSNKDDEVLNFYDYRKFSIIKQIEFKNKIKEYEFDKSNSILIITTQQGSICCIDAITLDDNPLAVIPAHYSTINTISISPSNKIFALGSDDALISLFDMYELMSFKVLKKCELPIKKIEFSHDNKLLSAIYEGGNSLDIFDSESSECIYSLFSETQLYSICWHPSSVILAFSADDKNRNSNEEGNVQLLISPINKIN
jgi:THO complex subunit 3